MHPPFVARGGAALGGIAAGRADEVRACQFEVKARCASGDARVILDGGAVKRLEVDVVWCGEKGQPGQSRDRAASGVSGLPNANCQVPNSSNLRSSSFR